MSLSSAPCLYGSHSWEKAKGIKRCYADSVNGTGYCQKHQPPPFEHQNWSRPQNWGKIQQDVIIRDKGICYICGKAGATQVDHVIPLAAGGTNSLFNLKAVHKLCHARKTEADIKKILAEAKQKDEKIFSDRGVDP